MPLIGIQNATIAHHQINDEIVRLEARIVDLKTSRNTLASVSCLHDDIMLMIFRLSCHPPNERDHPIVTTPLSLTWVCTSWRALAHNSSYLWSRIESLNPIWIEQVLPRTRGCLLHFDLTLPPQYHGDADRVALLCLSNLHRIATLSICDWSRDLCHFPRMSPMWGAPALNLVKLTLHNIYLPPTLFQGSFPALQSLTLHDCEVDWAFVPVRMGLHELDVSNPVNKASAENVVRILQVIAPEIEKLCLCHTLLPSISPLMLLRSPAQRYHLQNVRSFEICEKHPSPITVLLNHVSFPPQIPMGSIKIEPAFADILEVIDQLDMARAFVSSRELHLAAWPVLVVEVFILGDDITIILTEGRSGNASIDTNGEQCVQPNFTSTIELTFKISVTSHSDIMPVFSILPLPPIQSLILSGGNYHDYGPELTNFFNSATQGAVRTLEVDMMYLNTFTHTIKDQSHRVRALTDAPGNPRSGQEELATQCHDILGFHHLKTIRYYGDDLVNDSQFTWDYYTVLKEWLEWRQLVGLRLSKLVFKTMNIPAKDRLRELFTSDGGVVDILEFEYLGCTIHKTISWTRDVLCQIRLEDLLEKQLGVLERAGVHLSHPKASSLSVIDPIRALERALDHHPIHFVMAPTRLQIDLGMEERQVQFATLRAFILRTMHQYMDVSPTSVPPSQQKEKFDDLIEEKKEHFSTEAKIASLKTYLRKKIHNSRFLSRQSTQGNAGDDTQDANRGGSHSENDGGGHVTGIAARRGNLAEVRGRSASSRPSRSRRNESASGVTTRQGLSSPYPTRDRRLVDNPTRTTTQLPRIKEESDDEREVGTSRPDTLSTFLLEGCGEPLPHFYKPLKAYGCKNMRRIREIAQWDITLILNMTQQLRTQSGRDQPLSRMDRDRLAHAILRLGRRD
ncbi:hypothetical protein BDN72DRAFT_865309 [Pluteus cervinus]|uniref:Uncharacterized protein n=1 Tax=Pluteus cervinus TaxID=181527 RepID=A0ACD3A0T1_9AGAR|nr:hypothetical protein BDN72DRAFT_865309 [Pluteus cervinus]